jgi:hypothetical protein
MNSHLQTDCQVSKLADCVDEVMDHQKQLSKRLDDLHQTEAQKALKTMATKILFQSEE